MSMTGHFVAISPAELNKLIDDPDSSDLLSEPPIGGTGQEAPYLEVDKAWHGIHFLLTGDAWGGRPPLGNAVLGGTEVGEDIAYGPMRYLTVEEVAEVAEALSAIGRDELAARYIGEDLAANDIYPNIWDEGSEALDYLLSYYERLVAFYKAAAAQKQAALLFLA